MKLQFTGRHALVLGGSSDLGLELARLLIQEDLIPLLTFRSKAGETRIHERLAQYEGRYQTAYLDFSRMESIQSLFDKVNRNLDFLVDFIHGNLEGLVGSVDTRDAVAYFAENVSARAEVIKRAGRAMLGGKKGRMIFISSIAAEKPNPGQGFYAASKLASEALYRNMGLELGERGISAVILRPGYIDAGRGKRYLDSREPLPSGPKDRMKVLTVKEMAETILFFLSDQAGGFTTTTITMGGSWKKLE
ncbi:MAG: SDR family oxidoreductase [Desulfobacteraceae bacterium]|nr:MAG: SDR family oxidoreductase [Desulfobacteraceae bacterium]